MTWIRMAALVLVVSAFAAYGCGGSTKSSEGSSSSTAKSGAPTPKEATGETSSALEHVTRAELLVKGNAICRRLNDRRAATRLHGPESVATVIPPLGAYEVQAVAAMRKLVPPASFGSGWGQIVDETNTLAEITVAVGKAAQEGKLERTRVLDPTLTSALARLRTIAKREGFAECAKRT